MEEPAYDYESLQAILSEESGREVSLEEATRVGDDLMELYAAFLSPDVVESNT